MPAGLPYRGDGTGRPAGLPLPPGRMPLWRDRRPLKRWRYVGVYGEELMLCAGTARIAGLPQAFWAVWDRAGAQLHERTAFRPGAVGLPDGAVRFRARAVVVELALDPAGEPVEVVSRHGGSYIWTRKQPVRARGTVEIAGRTRPVDAAALVDDSAGYHARATAWSWSAGVGTAVDGSALAWNLVAGVHDAPTGSERTAWVAGRAEEVGPATFAKELDSVSFGDGGELRFAAEAVRERDDNLLILRSAYRQPFGTFTGELPGGVALASGFGVMERHDVRW